MRNRCKRIIGLLLAVITVVSAAVPLTSGGAVFAAENKAVSQELAKTRSYILKNVSNPTVSSIGGEWTVIGLARSSGFNKDAKTDKAIDNYYKNACSTVKAVKGELHARKYTEYSRVILAMSAIGKNPKSVSGYNLLAKLSDFDKVKLQGVNGAIFALLAFDSKDYEIPKAASGTTQTTRDRLIAEILGSEVAGGGFALSGEAIDIDVTAMALQALAPYRSRSDVSGAIERALSALSKAQRSDGGFSNYGEISSETCAQVTVALCTLNINPNSSARFVKNGSSVIDALLAFSLKDGSFEHTKGGGSNLMATEQAFYALAAYDRFTNSLSPLYDMNDAVPSANGVSVHIDRNAVHFTDTYGYPFIDAQNRVQVPLRAAMEAYGCSVSWKADSRTAVIACGGTTVNVKVGSKQITYKKGTSQKSNTVKNDTEAVIINGRVYVPIRAVIEIFGGDVSWNSGRRSVIIEK